MSDKESGRWLPYNQDGSVHDCRPTATNDNGKDNGKNKVTLQAVQKRLEEIGIIINVQKLMKQ
jgi:hypothetical protein